MDIYLVTVVTGIGFDQREQPWAAFDSRNEARVYAEKFNNNLKELKLFWRGIELKAENWDNRPQEYQWIDVTGAYASVYGPLELNPDSLYEGGPLSRTLSMRGLKKIQGITE